MICPAGQGRHLFEGLRRDRQEAWRVDGITLHTSHFTLQTSFFTRARRRPIRRGGPSGAKQRLFQEGDPVAYRLGIDIGGTFTDATLINEATGEIRIGKVPSTAKGPFAGPAGSRSADSERKTASTPPR